MPLDFELLHTYWHSLADGAAPDHALVEPGPILDLLPYLMLVEFEDDPFRIHYVMSGSKLDYVSDLDLTGHYLDEFAIDADVNGPRAVAVEILTRHYLACRQTGKPAYGTYEWPDKNGFLWQVEFALFPLTVDGVIRRCLALDYYGFDPDNGPDGKAIDPRLPIFD